MREMSIGIDGEHGGGLGSSGGSGGSGGSSGGGGGLSLGDDLFEGDRSWNALYAWGVDAVETKRAQRHLLSVVFGSWLALARIAGWSPFPPPRFRVAHGEAVIRRQCSMPRPTDTTSPLSAAPFVIPPPYA